MNERPLETPAGGILLEETFRQAMARVYLWMAGGLALTAIVAISLAQSEAVAQAVYDKPIIYIGLFAAQMILVIAISGGIDKMAPATALGLFFVYSALMGASLSTLFLVYDLGTMGPAAISATAMFTALSIIGLTTETDLSGWGNALFTALIGLIVALVANALFQSNGLEWGVSIAGVVIFIGLTVYDTQEIK